jgi:hypothetical protein
MPKKEMPDLTTILGMPDTKVVYQPKWVSRLKLAVVAGVAGTVAYLVVAPWAAHKGAACDLELTQSTSCHIVVGFYDIFH